MRTDWAARGAAVLHLVDDTSVLAAMAVDDEVRPEAAAVADLHALGVSHVAMITGDAGSVAAGSTHWSAMIVTALLARVSTESWNTSGRL
jgi:cation transport ATPase